VLLFIFIFFKRFYVAVRSLGVRSATRATCTTRMLAAIF